MLDLKWKSPFKPVVKLCPRCLSPVENLQPQLMGISPNRYYCEKCGYQGTVYIEKDLDLDAAKPEGKGIKVKYDAGEGQA